MAPKPNWPTRRLICPAATAPPAPAPPSLAGSPPLQSHEIFGYAPYWTLPQSSGFDVQDLTTLAYFSIGVNGDGTLQESGAGWNGYESQDLANLVTRSHAAGDRVVLTVTDFSQASLNAITSSPTRGGDVVGCPHRGRVGQEPRWGELRLRGSGERGPQRAHHA